MFSKPRLLSVMSALPVSLLLLLLASSTDAASLCFFPDGFQSPDVPCDPKAEVSMCCGSVAACLSNGLCKDASTTNTTGISYARGTCSDPKWQSPICPQTCQLNQDTAKNSSAFDFRSNGVQMWECNAEGFGKPANYCCESDSEKSRCCSTSTALFALNSASPGNALPNQKQGSGVGISVDATTTGSPTVTMSSRGKTSRASATSTQVSAKANASSSPITNSRAGTTYFSSAITESVSSPSPAQESSSPSALLSEINAGLGIDSSRNGINSSGMRQGFSTEKMVAVGVGASVGSAAMVGLVVFFLYKRRECKRSDTMSLYSVRPASAMDQWYGGAARPAELDMSRINSIRSTQNDQHKSISPVVSEMDTVVTRESKSASPMSDKNAKMLNKQSRLFELE